MGRQDVSEYRELVNTIIINVATTHENATSIVFFDIGGRSLFRDRAESRVSISDSQ